MQKYRKIQKDTQSFQHLCGVGGGGVRDADVKAYFDFKSNVCCVSGSSEQHGGGATMNMNVNLVTPDKVSASARRRYETQV